MNHSIIFLIPLIALALVIPVHAQIANEDDGATTVRGIPEEKLDCEFEKGTTDCKPNKRMIIFGIYDTQKNSDSARFETALSSQKTIREPAVEEIPLTREKYDEAGRYETVITSFEFDNADSEKVGQIRASLSSGGLLSTAEYVRITEFDTWHHFDEEQVRPCVITNVIEFGDESILDVIDG